MAKSSPLAVKPRILQWARRRAGLDVPALAERMKMNPEKLQEWESGKGHPTFNEASKLAQKTYLPFGYLFLNEPIDEELGIVDFRTLPGKKKSTPSVDLLDVVQTAQHQQSWFREYLITECNEEPLPCFRPPTIIKRNKEPLPCFQSSPETDEDKIARQIRDFFEWDELQFEQHGKKRKFLREYIDRAHDKGFLISLSGKVGSNSNRPLDNEEFRGFALFDEYVPLVFINTKQSSPHAQLFTLAHELAHLFRRKSGIDSAKWEGVHKSIHAEEAACNRIAASALMPSEYFNEKWANTNGNERQKIEKVSRIFKVSKMATAIRAFDTQNVSEFLCNDVCAEEKMRYEERRSKSKPRVRVVEKVKSKEHLEEQENKKPNDKARHFASLCNHLPGGKRFARAVVSSVGSGDLSHTAAFDLLDGSSKDFYTCVKHLSW